MRRISTRARAKVVDDNEAPTPPKRPTRRGRRKKSESSSDQDSDSEEEVMPTPKTRRAVAPPPEERPVPSTPGGSRTRRSSRRLEPAVEEVKPVEPIVIDLDADNNVDRDSNGSNETEADSSTVWKVQNSNGSGSGIAKLKLCRSGPVEQPEIASPRRRRGARDPEMHTVMEVEESLPQHVSAIVAQPSPTPEPDSSGLTGKARAVRRLEEVSKESSSSSSSSASSTSSSSSSEKSRSSTPDKAESEPVEEDDDDDDEESKDDAKDVEDEEEEEEDDDDEIQIIKDDTKEDSPPAFEPSEDATSVDVPSETAEDADQISVPSKSPEEVEDSSSREAEESAPALRPTVVTSLKDVKIVIASTKPQIVEPKAAGTVSSVKIKAVVEEKQTVKELAKVKVEVPVTAVETAKQEAIKLKGKVEETSRIKAEECGQVKLDTKVKEERTALTKTAVTGECSQGLLTVQAVSVKHEIKEKPVKEDSKRQTEEVKPATALLEKLATAPVEKPGKPATAFLEKPGKPATAFLEKLATARVEKTASVPVEKPATAPLEKPATAPLEKPATAPLEKPATAPLEKPATAPLEKPATAPLQKTATAPVEKTATAPVEKPATAPMEKLATAPVEKPATAPVEKPTTASVVKTAAVPVEKPATAPMEKPATATVEKPATTPLEKSATVPVEKPSEDTSKKLPKDTPEKSSKDSEVKVDSKPQLKSDKGSEVKSDKDSLVKTDKGSEVKSDKDSLVKTDKSAEVKFDKGAEVKSVKGAEAKSVKGPEVKSVKDSQPSTVSEKPAEEDEQSDDEPVMDLAPGSPVEPDPEMAEAEAIEAQVEEKSRGRRRHHRSASSSSSEASSSDSESRLKRKKKRSSSKDRRTSSPQKPIQMRKGLPPKQEEAKVEKESITEPPKEELPAPPTRLRRKPAISLEQAEKVSLRRTISGPSNEDQVKVDEATVPENPTPSGDVTVDENKENSTSAVCPDDEAKPTEQPVTRKRRWGSCKSIKKPVLCISSDPLKNLIPDAKPVAESEVHLNLEEEGEVIEDEELMSKLERVKERIVMDRPLPPPSVPLPETTRIVVSTSVDTEEKKVERKISVTNDGSRATSSKSPTLIKQRISTVLYITNLVRPFTIGQLRELLSRTGKFAEGGFWINSIKSKCYVEYDNEDQAVETRHALHGVHWPISNRKALHVEFAKKDDMLAAQAETDGEPTIIRKTHQTGDSHLKEVKDLDEKVNKVAQPVREWDLGKVQDLVRSDSRDITHDDRKKREDERRVRREKRSLTPSHEGPARKAKKSEDAAPAKLLDDLFRKTKTTPCIYWLPLTPEQIAEKEEMRRKHMAEHERLRAEIRRAHERNMQRGPGREQDRGRDRDRERERDRDRDRERERDRKERRRGSKDK